MRLGDISVYIYIFLIGPKRASLLAQPSLCWCRCWRCARQAELLRLKVIDRDPYFTWRCSLSWFLCCHLAVTSSHFEGLSMEKRHGSHGRKHGKCNGSRGKKVTMVKGRRGQMSWRPLQKGHDTPERNPFRAAWCFIRMKHHDSA